MKKSSKNNDVLIDEVISLLSDSGGSLRLLDISKSLGLKSDTIEYEELKDVLNMLSQQKVINKNTRRRYSIEKQNYNDGIIGILKINGKTFFVETEDIDIPIVFVSNNDLNTAIIGDKVVVQLKQSNKKGKLKGKIIDILDRNIDEITGTIQYQDDNYYLIPDNKKLNTDFLISKKNLNEAKDGDKVLGKFIAWNNFNEVPIAKVIKVFGKNNDTITAYNQIIKEFNLPISFLSSVINEVNDFKAPQNRKIKDRLDLRNEIVITIDPVTAKDFDDALSLTKLENGNYYLGVHIADVSYYVTENSELDREALKRGNSVYLVDRVIPMLPELLSNDICSLNPEVVRYTFSVMMEINDNLEIVNYLISPSMIKSCRRFTYDEVQEIIDSGNGDEKELILELHSLANKFRNNRLKNNSINFDTKEVKYILDDKLYPIGVELHQTTAATSLVEEFMLLANKQVAKHLQFLSKKYNFTDLLPFLYRIHDEPKQDAISNAFEQLKSLGIKFKSTGSIPETLNNILEQVKNIPENDVVNQILIRSMPKAVYSSVNIGHFGLGFKNYSHFTSPIRRYPDLIVHRLLREYSKEAPSNKRINQLRKDMIYVAEHTSDTERQAMEAERASTKLASSIYAKTLLGEVFEGSVSGVQPYGIFVILDEVYIEGLVNKRDLLKDNYDFDEKHLKLKGKKRSYSFGTRVKVRIIRVNVDKRQIDLAIEE